MFITMICQKKITISTNHQQGKRKWVEKINEKKVCLPKESALMCLMDSLGHQSRINNTHKNETNVISFSSSSMQKKKAIKIVILTSKRKSRRPAKADVSVSFGSAHTRIN